MPINQIHESAVTQRGGLGKTVPIHVLSDDGTTARIRIEGAGLYLQQGHTHTVPSNTIQPNH